MGLLAAGSARARRAVLRLRRHAFSPGDRTYPIRRLRYYTFRYGSPAPETVYDGPVRARASRIAAATRVRAARSAEWRERRRRWDLEVDLVVVGSGLGATSRGDRRARPGRRVRGAREGAEARRPLRLRRRRGLRPRQPAHEEARPRGLAGRRPPVRRVPRARLRQPAAPRQAARHHARGRRVLRGQGRRALEGLPGPARLLLPRRARLEGERPLPLGRALRRRRRSASGSTKTFLTPIMPIGALHEEMYAWGGLAKVTTLELRAARPAHRRRPAHASAPA